MMGPGLVTVFLFQFVADLEQLPAAVHHARRRPSSSRSPSGCRAAQPGRVAARAVHLVITGALLSIIPLIALFLVLQRYWRVDLAAGAVKA